MSFRPARPASGGMTSAKREYSSMSAPLYIKVKDADNVAIAVHDIPRGTEIMP